MTKNVFAEKWEIAGKNGMNKSIARFPDVCLSPPSPPAGPIPIPYPDTSFSNNLKEGSETVFVGGKPAALAQKSYYKEPILGNEAATRTFGSSVVTHQITGKTYFQAWCMSVKFEGKNVCRHFDITTSNHTSYVGATPPAPAAETLTVKDANAALKAGTCPCCGGPRHEWQEDKNGKPFKAVTEKTFWDNRIKQIRPDQAHKIRRFKRNLRVMLKLKAEQRKLAKEGKPSCPNVHKTSNQGCAIYLEIPANTRIVPPAGSPPGTIGQTPAQSAYADFNATTRALAVTEWQTVTGKIIPARFPKSVSRSRKRASKMNHKTPRMAGGCNNPANVVPQFFMQYPECNRIENLQGKLEGIGSIC